MEIDCLRSGKRKRSQVRQMIHKFLIIVILDFLMSNTLQRVTSNVTGTGLDPYCSKARQQLFLSSQKCFNGQFENQHRTRRGNDSLDVAACGVDVKESRDAPNQDKNSERIRN